MASEKKPSPKAKRGTVRWGCMMTDGPHVDITIRSPQLFATFRLTGRLCTAWLARAVHTYICSISCYLCFIVEGVCRKVGWVLTMDGCTGGDCNGSNARTNHTDRSS